MRIIVSDSGALAPLPLSCVLVYLQLREGQLTAIDELRDYKTWAGIMLGYASGDAAK
jgi:hypothetical protein